jgi:probable HAF family extracellular repeat protein
MRNKLTLSISAMLLAGVATVANAQALPKFQATVVGSAPFSPSCVVRLLSDTGVMAGECDPFSTYAGGIVVWRDGVATPYGKLPKGTYAQANAINSLGVVAGEGDLGDGRPHALVTYKGALFQMKDGGVNDRAIGITDIGVLFGNVIKGFDAPWTPVFWTADAAKPDRYRMSVLPYYNDGGDPKSFGATLLASNKAGQAVGWINGGVIGQWGGFWNNDAAHTVVPLAPLATGNHSIAWAMNDIGQAVGESNSGMLYSRAVLWQNDATHSIVDLGTLPGDTLSNALFINNAGQVVGFSGTGIQGSTSRMFFYQNGTMTDLSSLVDTTSGTWEITTVSALNNAGQMIAGGRLNGQLVSNVLLTPIQ